jgi:predicted nucleic-acid-binding Zn-ribbon protein
MRKYEIQNNQTKRQEEGLDIAYIIDVNNNRFYSVLCVFAAFLPERYESPRSAAHYCE